MRPSENRSTILVVDDFESVRRFLCAALAEGGYATLEAADGAAAIQCVRDQRPDAVLLDIRLPDLSGMDVLVRLRALAPDLPVIMVTGLDDVDTAVQAMHLGACNYLTKPITGEQALASVQQALERGTDRAAAASPLGRMPPLTELLGHSEAIERLSAQVERLAETTYPALIVGEAGTGKEIVSRAVHAHSERRRGPFLAVDAGGLIPPWADITLFGLTDPQDGAAAAPCGQIELAHGGTLFLSDVCFLPLGAQDRLLGFLQTGEVHPMGGGAVQRPDARLLAGSSAELQELVAGGLFRRDLYLALARNVLTMPPLRTRPHDIRDLTLSIVRAASAALGKDAQDPAPEAMDALLAYPWPGNLRELRHTVRRAAAMAEDRIEPRHLDILPR